MSVEVNNRFIRHKIDIKKIGQIECGFYDNDNDNSNL